MSPELDKLIADAKERVSKMSDQEIKEMLRVQAEGWVRSEMQWAKDFHEGKCERD